MSRVFLTTLCVISTALAAPDDPRPARTHDVSIRYDEAKRAIVVVGIDPDNLRSLAKLERDADRWPAVLSLSVASNKANPLPITGTYRVVADALRFEPKFPLEPGLEYIAKFDPSRLPVARSERDSRLTFRLPAPDKPAPAIVARVEPSGDVLPENLLKFYLHFSAPMSRGEVYDRARLVDASGAPVEGAFLRIGEELWDASGTRITLLLDPGRIKRGLRPREEEGPILEAGKTYALVIDREWPDAAGQPMREAFKKTFRAGPEQTKRLDPKDWVIKAPAASTKAPLVLTFPTPLDRAMLDHAIVLLDPQGKKVAGRASVGEGSTRWEFTPTGEWSSGAYQLEIDSELEDLAGNSVARAFEVDIEGQIAAKADVRRVTLPITIPAARGR
jgi:hypothetical protein